MKISEVIQAHSSIYTGHSVSCPSPKAKIYLLMVISTCEFCCTVAGINIGGANSKPLYQAQVWLLLTVLSKRCGCTDVE
jgi:hypothetical protein